MTQKIEWQKISGNEFRVGENRISILKDSVLLIEVIGEQTDEHAKVILENYKEIFNNIPGKVKQLVNLNKSGKSSHTSRMLFKELNENELTDKVAVYGVHPVARILAAFVIDITNKKNIRFFSNETDALSWLLNA